MLRNIIFIGLFLVLVPLYIRYIELRSIFYPYRPVEASPKDIGLVYEDIYFKTQDGVLLNGWLIKKPKADTTILFFHGNGGNISHRLDKILLFYKLGLNIFIIDYRGYGKSQGRPTEVGIYRDGCAAYDYLITRRDLLGKKIAYGESLGSAVAIDLCRNRSLDGLIVDSGFSCAKDMARIVYPFIPPFLIYSKFDSLQKVKDIVIPKLFVHSRNDEIVPFYLGEKLFKAASGPKEFLQINGGHNSGFWESRELIRSGLERFLKDFKFISG